jgi:hypothetical protein
MATIPHRWGRQDKKKPLKGVFLRKMASIFQEKRSGGSLARGHRWIKALEKTRKGHLWRALMRKNDATPHRWR